MQQTQVSHETSPHQDQILSMRHAQKVSRKNVAPIEKIFLGRRDIQCFEYLNLSTYDRYYGKGPSVQAVHWWVDTLQSPKVEVPPFHFHFDDLLYDLLYGHHGF